MFEVYAEGRQKKEREGKEKQTFYEGLPVLFMSKIDGFEWTDAWFDNGNVEIGRSWR